MKTRTEVAVGAAAVALAGAAFVGLRNFRTIPDGLIEESPPTASLPDQELFDGNQVLPKPPTSSDTKLFTETERVLIEDARTLSKALQEGGAKTTSTSSDRVERDTNRVADDLRADDVTHDGRTPGDSNVWTEETTDWHLIRAHDSLEHSMRHYGWGSPDSVAMHQEVMNMGLMLNVSVGRIRELTELFENAPGIGVRTEGYLSLIGRHTGPVYGTVYLYGIKHPETQDSFGQIVFSPTALNNDLYTFEGFMMPHDQSLGNQSKLSIFLVNAWLSDGSPVDLQPDGKLLTFMERFNFLPKE